MPTTSNFGWTTPADTDLVKDGAAAIRTLGNGIDTSLVDLKGGTTNQVLAKNSNTDLDFQWITQNDADAIQNSIVDAKGDLISATAADTPSRLASSNVNGDVLTVDTSTATGLKWAAPSVSAVNKNYLINGGFAIAQRGTSFTASNNNDDAYTLDRWYILSDTNDVIDVTQESSVVPTDGQFALAMDVETINKKFGIATILEQKDCLGIIGKSVTFSFKAKVSSTGKLDNVKAAIIAWSGSADTVTSDIISAWNVEGTNPTLIANATYENSPVNLNLTTSYATYSVSATIDTANAKNVILFIWSDVTDTTLGDFLYIAEAKLELGTSATSFNYAGGTIQGELASCQRYYWRDNSATATTNYHTFGQGFNSATNKMFMHTTFPVQMRTAPTPTYLAAANYNTFVANALTAVSSFSADTANVTNITVGVNVATTPFTAGQGGSVVAANNKTAYIEYSSEL